MAASAPALQAHGGWWPTNGDGYLTATMRDFQRLFPTAADFRRMGSIRQQETLAAVGLSAWTMPGALSLLPGPWPAAMLRQVLGA